MGTMPAPSAPADQAILFAAHDRMLHDAVDWLEGTHAPLKGIGSRVLVGLLARILQLGTALQRLCEVGHAGEGAPIARAMVSACVILVYIAEDRDRRTAAYMETDQLERKKRIRLYREAVEAGKPHFWAEELADIERKDAELSAIQAQKVAALAEQGVVPIRLGQRRDTVSGLNERDLFQAMNATYWYQAYYKLFSDEVHVSSNALYTELVEQLSGQSLVGGKFENPFHVLVASRDMVMNALEQIDGAVGLGQRDKLAAIDARIAAALSTFREAQGISKVRRNDAGPDIT
jgi:uncharacterized protein DUF5677